jgi:hypothetical protein
MLRSIDIDNIRPNPFRRLDEYPILREKVEVLKESIAQTGFWGTIVGRPAGDGIEIAFGHHRLVALRELEVGRVEVIVRDLSNEDMLRMMARENLEEWGTSAWVELETIRATIAAYGRGEITLPAVPPKTPQDAIRYVSQCPDSHPYTQSTVATFLGWTRKNHQDDLRPNYACEVAFQALDLIDAGLLREADVRGLKRGQLGELVKEQRAIYNSEMRYAAREQELAMRARERAAAAQAPAERRRYEKQAEVYTEQARTAEKAAGDSARAFGEQGAGLFREDRGRDAVRWRADELKAVVHRPVKLHTVGDLADRIAHKLGAMLAEESEIRKDFRFLKRNLADAEPRAIDGLCGSIAALIGRLQRLEKWLRSHSRSHPEGTGTDQARRKAIGGP